MFPDPLRAFQHVVRAGTIRKASEELSVAPSSISRQVAILERMIGTPLFRRSAHGLTLTHAGKMVAEYSDMVISGFDALRIDLNDTRGASHLISVAMVESVTSFGPTKAIMAFRETYPDTTFNFRILPAPAVIEAVQTQKCDIGIGFNTELDSTITRLAQIKEPVVAVLPADHPLSKRDGLRLQDISNEQLAIPGREFGFRRIFDRVCSNNDLTIRAVLETNSFESLRDFVRSGAGIALLPQRAAWRDMVTGLVTVVPLEHSMFRDSTLDIFILKQVRLARVTRLFAGALEEHLSLDSI